MSDQSETTAKRPYRKRRRAALEEQTRRRITEATVDLHGSLGPARTTVSAIADRAGVQRATVYRHFPDEEALFAACSSHFIAENPRPDPGEWARVEDPGVRLPAALAELYEWYERTEYMLEKTTRDVALVPALRPSMERFAGWYEYAATTLISGRPERGARRRRVHAAIGHALEFDTWRSLVRRQGLSRADAVGLMEKLVDGAAA
jgi:AcrR family transcriptional regulator